MSFIVHPFDTTPRWSAWLAACLMASLTLLVSASAGAQERTELLIAGGFDVIWRSSDEGASWDTQLAAITVLAPVAPPQWARCRIDETQTETIMTCTFDESLVQPFRILVTLAAADGDEIATLPVDDPVSQREIMLDLSDVSFPIDVSLTVFLDARQHGVIGLDLTRLTQTRRLDAPADLGPGSTWIVEAPFDLWPIHIVQDGITSAELTAQPVVVDLGDWQIGTVDDPGGSVWEYAPAFALGTDPAAAGRLVGVEGGLGLTMTADESELDVRIEAPGRYIASSGGLAAATNDTRFRGCTQDDFSTWVESLDTDPERLGEVYIGANIFNQVGLADPVVLSLSDNGARSLAPRFSYSEAEILGCDAESQIEMVCRSLPLGGGSTIREHGGRPLPRSLYFDRTSPGVRALVSTDLGLHVTWDGGETWRWICEDIIGFDVFAFGLAGPDEGNPIERRMLVGAVGINQDDPPAPIPGIYTSTDGGCNWQPVEGLLAGQWSTSILVHPEDPNDVLIGTRRDPGKGKGIGPRGVARSNDGGETWNATSLTDLATPVTSMVRAPTNPMVVYASTETALARSDDGGQTWTPFAEDIANPDDNETLDVLGVDPADADKLYFVHNGIFGPAVHRTDNGGQDSQIVYEDELFAFAITTVEDPGPTPSCGVFDDLAPEPDPPEDDPDDVGADVSADTDVPDSPDSGRPQDAATNGVSKNGGGCCAQVGAAPRANPRIPLVIVAVVGLIVALRRRQSSVRAPR